METVRAGPPPLQTRCRNSKTTGDGSLQAARAACAAGSERGFKMLNRTGHHVLGNGMEIDAVYTWVDGADPAHRAKRARFRPHEDARDATAERWRDNNELRYSLRSLHRYAPWIRRIFIVTDGQVPSWLDTAHPRIEIVDHTAIFPDRRFLPTFNSCVIEAFLHRIPGLAERYLYLNDDFFLGQPVAPSDFVTESGRQILHVENTPLPRFRQLALMRADRHSRLKAYCRFLLRLSLGPTARLRDVPHVPQFFVKSDVAAVWERYARPLRWGLSQRFRGMRMPLFRTLYVNTLLETGDPECGPVGRILTDEDYQFVMLKDEGSRRGLSEVMEKPAKFFCINDDRRHAAAQPRLVVLLAMTLRHCFPQPSPFEPASGEGANSWRDVASGAAGNYFTPPLPPAAHTAPARGSAA